MKTNHGSSQRVEVNGQWTKNGRRDDRQALDHGSDLYVSDDGSDLYRHGEKWSNVG